MLLLFFEGSTDVTSNTICYLLWLAQVLLLGLDWNSTTKVATITSMGNTDRGNPYDSLLLDKKVS